MSPDRGLQRPPASMQGIAHNKSMDKTIGASLARTHTMPVKPFPESRPTKNHASRSTFTTNCSSHELVHNKTNVVAHLDGKKHVAVSVKSMSSTEHSRRDSAVSTVSQHNRRPRTSRASSKRSSDSSTGEAMVKTVSNSNKRRPRGQRFASSGSFHNPNTNIEETLALHARSCELFASVSRPTTAYASSMPSHSSIPHHSLHRSLSSTDAWPLSQPSNPPPLPTFSTPLYSSQPDLAVEEPQLHGDNVPATILHWTSDEVRRKEYEAIDRSNNGVRGLLRRMLPKWACKNSSKFYDDKDGSDCGSVRRIRLDMPSAEVEECGRGRSRKPAPRNFGI